MRRSNLVIPLSGAIATCAALAHAAESPSPPRYTLTRSVVLGAPDRWDYVVFDAPSHRVYVAHGDRLTVVDGRDGAILGEVTGMAGGTHGIAISTATGQGYTDDGRAGEAVAFDLKSLAVKARIAVEKDADAVALDPATGHVFVIEGDAKAVTAIDPMTNTVIARIDGGEGLEYAAADCRGALFVAGEEKRDVVRIDTATNTVTAHWPIADCDSPHGLAVDPEHHRVFVSCVNQRLVVVDSVSGEEIAGAAIGKGADAAVFDAARGLVFSSNGRDGTISVIAQTEGHTYTLLATVATAVSGRTMSLDPATGRLYVAAADVDPSPTTGGRPVPRPGTLKLLFLDPAP